MVEVIACASEWVEAEHIGAYLDAFHLNVTVERYNGANPKSNGQKEFLLSGAPSELEKAVKGFTGRWIWNYEIR